MSNWGEMKSQCSLICNSNMAHAVQQFSFFFFSMCDFLWRISYSVHWCLLIDYMFFWYFVFRSSIDISTFSLCLFLDIYFLWDIIVLVLYCRFIYQHVCYLNMKKLLLLYVYFKCCNFAICVEFKKFWWRLVIEDGLIFCPITLIASLPISSLFNSCTCVCLYLGIETYLKKSVELRHPCLTPKTQIELTSNSETPDSTPLPILSRDIANGSSFSQRTLLMYPLVTCQVTPL
jgi:hypothetical protein